MTLPMLAIAYIVGVWIGSALAESGLPGCEFPRWFWAAKNAGLTGHLCHATIGKAETIRVVALSPQ